MVGVAITTSSICVGARCPHARAGVGAVATQNITDPALGPAILAVLATGKSAQQALATVIDGRPYLDYRQLTVIDNNSQTASYTGRNILGVNAVAEGDGCIAAGNLLASANVVAAMTAAFAQHDNQHLANRLLLSVEAGLAAGGEQGDVHSAALLVADAESYPLVDLRVDWDDSAPLAGLRRLWHDYEPQIADYLTRALRPDQAPAYGVAGDL